MSAPTTQHSAGEPSGARKKPILAAALLLMGSAVVAMTTVLAKALGTDALGPALHPLQVTHGRFIFALAAIALVGAIFRPVTKPAALKIHAARSVCGFTGVTMLFAATTMIPLADATAISFLSPAITMALAALVLREKVVASRWLAAAIALSGAIVLLRPGADALAVGAVFAFAAAVIMGVEVMCIKHLADREPTFQILLIANIFSTVFSSIAVIAVWQAPNATQWLALWGLGTLMLCAQVCYVTALRMADASYVAPVAYTTLIFAGIYDVVIFAAWPDVVSFVGAGLILVGAIVLTTREKR